MSEPAGRVGQIQAAMEAAGIDAVVLRLAENIVRYIRSNQGKLSKRRREGEFNRLTEAEVALLEGIVHDAFEGFEGGPERAAGGDAADA